MLSFVLGVSLGSIVFSAIAMAYARAALERSRLPRLGTAEQWHAVADAWSQWADGLVRSAPDVVLSAAVKRELIERELRALRARQSS